MKKEKIILSVFLFLLFVNFQVYTQTQVWATSYNGPGNGDDVAYSIATDNNGYTYVTGSSLGSGTGLDYATIQYNGSGTQQ